MNENYAQPSLPDGVADGIVSGLYLHSSYTAADAIARVRLVGSGTILREVIAAAQVLAQDWRVDSEVWSATSFSELARDARDVERWNSRHPSEAARVSHVATCLGGDTPIVAASDYVRAWPQLIAGYVQAPLLVLGTDGFGRSDTRAALRRYFEVDRNAIALCALHALKEQGRVSVDACMAAVERYGIDPERPAPWVR